MAKLNKTTAHNTDNKVHLFVTVFANCAQYHDISVDPYSVTEKANCSRTNKLHLTHCVPRHSHNSLNIASGRQKLRHGLPWHRDNVLAKEPGHEPVLRRPTQTHFIAGPLVLIRF